MAVQTLISALVGYVFGCIQSAYLVGRVFGQIDIREHGSGNAGASNVTTIMGIRYGVIVGVIDILKGTAAVLAVKALYPGIPDLWFLGGVMAVLGHIFPVLMKFRGGKGVATIVGMAFGLNWKLGLIFFLLVAVPALLADYIIAGSLTAFIALPIAAYLSGYSLLMVVIGFGMTALGFYLHRENIQRVLKKEELRVSSVYKKSEED
jgi:glycerol-3-phosphate acyltransferase PlsY